VVAAIQELCVGQSQIPIDNRFAFRVEREIAALRVKQSDQRSGFGIASQRRFP